MDRGVIPEVPASVPCAGSSPVADRHQNPGGMGAKREGPRDLLRAAESATSLAGSSWRLCPSLRDRVGLFSGRPDPQHL